MTEFKKNDLFYIPDEVVRKSLTIQEGIKIVEDIYEEYGKGNVFTAEPPGFTLQQIKENIAHFKVKGASIPSRGISGFRLIGFTPMRINNQIKETVIYSYCYLVDPLSAAPLALINESSQYILRTGLTAAATLWKLGKKNSKILGIVGTGKIARTALLGLNTLFSLEEIKVYDISENSLISFIKDLQDQTNLKFFPVDSPEEAIQGSDLILTATNADVPLVKGEWLKEGATLCSLGGSQELDFNLIKQVNKFIIDDFEYCTMVGSIHAWIERGFSTKEEIKNKLYGDLGEIYSGKKKGRENNFEKIVVIPQGLTALDLAFAFFVYEKNKNCTDLQKILIEGAN